jgi:GT2 family glycosyltransferase
LTYNRIELSSQYIPQICSKVGSIDHEILIWDNGSTDGSYDWIYQYGQANPFVYKTFGNETNLGMGAFNTLAKEARGKYIIKVDDDITVPKNFAARMVAAFEKVNEPKLLFLGWDFPWPKGPRAGGSTFATRSGMSQYAKLKGKVVSTGPNESVLINYFPNKWMINGVCRLSPRDKFLEIGGHPEGIIYGVDYHISKRAEKHGYWIGYFHNPTDLITHHGVQDTPEYRKFKDNELHKHKAPKHH